MILLVPDHKNFQEFDPGFFAQQSAELEGNLHQVVESERKAEQEKMGQIPENFCGRVLAPAASFEIVPAYKHEHLEAIDENREETRPMEDRHFVRRELKKWIKGEKLTLLRYSLLDPDDWEKIASCSKRFLEYMYYYQRLGGVNRHFIQLISKIRSFVEIKIADSKDIDWRYYLLMKQALNTEDASGTFSEKASQILMEERALLESFPSLRNRWAALTPEGDSIFVKKLQERTKRALQRCWKNARWLGPLRSHTYSLQFETPLSFSMLDGWLKEIEKDHKQKTVDIPEKFLFGWYKTLAAGRRLQKPIPEIVCE